MEKEINKFTKISTERVRKTTAGEIARQVGRRVEMSSKEEENKTEIVQPSKIKKEILELAKSGQSIDSFEKNVLIKEKKITGNRLGTRNLLKKALSFIMRTKTADDYKEMKDDVIKKAA